MQHAVRPCSVTALLARYLESRCNEHRSRRKGQTSIASSARHSIHEKLAAEAIVLERARHPSLATVPSSHRPTISFLLFFPPNRYGLYCSAFLPPTFRSSHCTHHFFFFFCLLRNSKLETCIDRLEFRTLSLFLPLFLPFFLSPFLSFYLSVPLLLFSRTRWNHSANGPVKDIP